MVSHDNYLHASWGCKWDYRERSGTNVPAVKVRRFNVGKAIMLGKISCAAKCRSDVSVHRQDVMLILGNCIEVTDQASRAMVIARSGEPPGRRAKLLATDNRRCFDKPENLFDRC